ncbi:MULTISPECIES: HAD hydrolase-like protein [Pseudomonas]|uniref:HAD hydrolase-like protein n=1 Tax=Pseudomonas TaxID=286 RepID=UPI00249E21F1|nr:MULTISPECIES: HAD hydrolase-like protein [Pseudomonas]MDI3374453.1 HAD hydrolase-like protein [Pseudomonas sp. V104_6]
MFDLVIFDLDNTLASSDDLEEFRGRAYLGKQSQSYKDRLVAKIGAQERRLLSAGFFEDLQDGNPDIKLAVFTKSPREYANIVLEEVYPEIDWDSVVAFEDVEHTKPAPDGILKIAKECGITECESVVLVGDDLGDIESAYSAGIRVILAEVMGKVPNYDARKRIPDASVVKEKTVYDAIVNIEQKLPVLEKLVEVGESDDRFFGRVCRIGHFPPKAIEDSRTPLQVISLGRLFTEHKALKNRREWHTLTDEIIAYKDTDNFPEDWAKCVRGAINEQIKGYRERKGASHMFKRYNVLITVAPTKAERPPRMENFLELIGSECDEHPLSNSSVEIAPEAFEFSAEARSHHGEHLTQIQRFENVRDCLSVGDTEFEGKLVFLIDDVVTTGATLYYMDKYSRENGAQEVFCISLAHTISAPREIR